ncbi:MAG: AraC family transcriptional regulator [bacterium]|nr:AraC family transcriptional regulator [bacterium]
MNAVTSSDQDFRVPTWYLGNIDDYVVRKGAQPGELFAAAGIDPAQVVPGGWVSSGQFFTLLREAARLSGNEGFGLVTGSEMTPASHGALGIAVLSSPTVRDAVLTLTRFFRTRTPLVIIDATLDTADASISISEAAVLGEAYRPMMELIMSTIINALRALTLGQFQATEISFDYPAPAHLRQYETLLRAPLRFDATRTSVRFNARFLDAPLALVDRTAAREAMEQCQHELDDLNRRTDLRDRVRARLLRHAGDFPDCARVAGDLHMTERTLRRKLAELGTSFQQILADTRRQLAEHLLRDSRMSVGEIAERLGYSDPSNFANAFRQWTGQGPRDFRQQSVAAPKKAGE